MKKLKTQNGITLIALVITIIILLILAGVALSIVFNGGIIEKSQNAVDSYNYSSKNEDEKLSDLEAKFQQLYNERVAGKEGEDGSGTVGTLASNVHVGDYIEYDPTLGVAEEDVDKLLKYTSPVGELSVTDPSGKLVVYEKAYDADDYTGTKTTYTAGNQVYEYNKAYELINEDGNIVVSNGTITGTDNVTYTVESDVPGNGHSSQSFQAKNGTNDKIWRVLDVNKTTGVVKIIPVYEIKTLENANFYMMGLRGYKNAVTELNNISAIFGHGTGAARSQSITVEEVNALTGYFPTEVTSGTNLTINSETKSWKNTQYNYEGTSKPGTSGTNDAYGVENARIYEMIFKRGKKNRMYYLASLCVYVNSSGAYFRVRRIAGEVDALNEWYVWDSGLERSDDYWNSGVLPVVTLKSDVNYKSGTGTSSTDLIKFQ